MARRYRPPFHFSHGKNAAKTRGKPFEAGNSGKPKGARHKATLAVATLLDGQADALTQKAIDRALEGDVTVLRLCLDRIALPSKERAVTFALRAIESLNDVRTALSALMHALAAGDLVPGEAFNIAGIIEKFRTANEMTALNARIAALERAAGE